MKSRKYFKWTSKDLQTRAPGLADKWLFFYSSIFSSGNLNSFYI